MHNLFYDQLIYWFTYLLDIRYHIKLRKITTYHLLRYTTLILPSGKFELCDTITDFMLVIL